MAAATLFGPSIDLQTPTTYPIRLGSSILRPAEASTYMSIRFNYRPTLESGTNISYLVKPGKRVEDSELVLTEGANTYCYAGKHGDIDGTYALVCRDAGEGKKLVLEKVAYHHVYNLNATPRDEDATKLANQYPQLSLEDDADGLVGNDDENEAPADPSNPFDYRHFLKHAAANKAKQRDSEVPRSSAATPTTHARPGGSTPAPKPKRPDQPLFFQKKRKAFADGDKPYAKRLKAGEEQPPAPPPASRAKPTKADAPRIRVDRKASLRRTSYDDSGELILENETQINEKLSQPRGAMALALSGQLRQGPISLRSAANSPVNDIASPVPARPPGMDDNGEFEIGSDSPEAPRKQGDAHSAGIDADADEEDADADADADVEDLELPSPVQAHKPSVSAAMVSAPDDEDDLDKQLALALREDDGGELAQALRKDQAESEEESEEE